MPARLPAAQFGHLEAQSGLLSASPENERDQRRRERFIEALAGLRFDRGRVELLIEPGGNAAEAERLAAEGRAALEQNQSIGAIAAYAGAIRQRPDQPGLMIGLGDAMTRRGELRLAEVAYRTAALQDDHTAEPQFKLAMTLARLAENESAIRQMQRVIELEPAHAQAHERLAIWRYYAGEHEAAWAHVRAAEALGHTMPPQFIALLQSSGTPGK
jgi:Flp pilus assembly protein TadD